MARRCLAIKYQRVVTGDNGEYAFVLGTHGHIADPGDWPTVDVCTG
jgi:hypothetical protein